MNCYDTPAHMTEEMVAASHEAPKAIIMSVYLGAVTGFVFLVSVCYCIGDITATAESTTGVPLIQIFYDSTGSVVGSCFLTSLGVIIVMGGANALMATGSRSLFAFARDGGLPFSSVFARVSPRFQVPIYAIVIATVVQMAMVSIYFGTLTGFNTVISIATEGYYLSYAMPLLSRLLAKATGTARNLDGPFQLGRYGIVLNAIGFIFLLFTAITFNFPTLSPVNSQNMNYTSAAIGIIMLISAATWLTTGRKGFTGPQVDGAPVVEVENNESQVGSKGKAIGESTSLSEGSGS